MGALPRPCVPVQHIGKQPPARVLLVRHGAVCVSPEGACTGQRDVALSACGRRQIARLGALVAGEEVAAVYASDLQRSRDSALLLAEPYGLPVVCAPELREISLGCWEGMMPEQIAACRPEEFAGYQQDPAGYRPFGGESFQDVHTRAVPFFTHLATCHRGQTILVVAHGGVNRVLLCHVLGMPLAQLRRFEQSYACLNCIVMYDEPLVLCVNALPDQEA